MPSFSTTDGLTKKDYQGQKSTLCTGCGHDSITSNLINALFLSKVNPYKVAKISGIGCSSKTPTYFLDKSHGFNSMHGRMAPVATGAKVVNHELMTLGISGDGDTASIGFGGFAHLLRRNLPMVYIVENNGVYGLTKGQFSATADKGSTIKSGEVNPFETIDLCSMAIDLGCSFVARSFSGDNKQLSQLLMAAFHHPGTALIDIISPCVTFANHEGSTKSFNYVKDHLSALHQVGFVESKDEISAEYEDGDTTQIKMHDGTYITLKKIDKQHDVTDRKSAITKLIDTRNSGEILTGLFYINEEKENFLQQLNLASTPIVNLTNNQLKPDPSHLKEIQKGFC